MNNEEQITKAPLLIRIIALLMLVGGLLWVALWVWTFFAFGSQFALANILTPLVAVAMIVLSFGIRKMKLWALYVYTVVIGVSIASKAYSLSNNPTSDSGMGWGLIAIQVLLVIYFWINKKNFR